MKLSDRVTHTTESITLKLNDKASMMAQEGKQVYNLTAGQLPFRPPAAFTASLEKELHLMKSFQYSPVLGFAELRAKEMAYFIKTRALPITVADQWTCLVSNGGKHSIYNALGSLLNPGDKVVVLAPYWISYPEMIRLWGGESVVVGSKSFHSYLPMLEDVAKALDTPGVVGIIINSPNNPTGTHYSEEWMKALAELMIQRPNVWALSDEIYFEVSYFDPRPTYFYQYQPELLSRTLITEGISKKLACTGLRIGFALGPRDLIEAMGRLQGQTTSGASSLAQRALMDLSFSEFDTYLPPILGHLRKNTITLREIFKSFGLTKAWYQPQSAFYFMLDLTQTPLWKEDWDDTDRSNEIAEDLLLKTGVATVPGTDFGAPNCLRFALVLEETPFEEAMTRLAKFLTNQI